MKSIILKFPTFNKQYYISENVALVGFHGTMREDKPNIITKKNYSYGGFHFGSVYAAIERSMHHVAGNVNVIKIYGVTVKLGRVLGTTKVPCTENDQVEIGGFEDGRDQARDNNIDGIIYTNEAEDKGSLSAMVFDWAIDKVELSEPALIKIFGFSDFEIVDDPDGILDNDDQLIVKGV